METMLEAIQRLRARGYDHDLSAVPGGRLRCDACGTIVDPGETVVEETVRFEGISNPSDQAILEALLAPCGHRGLYTSAYGVYASIDDGAVLESLPPR